MRGVGALCGALALMLGGEVRAGEGGTTAAVTDLHTTQRVPAGREAEAPSLVAVRVLFDGTYSARAMGNAERYDLRDPAGGAIPILAVRGNPVEPRSERWLGVDLFVRRNPPAGTTVTVQYPKRTVRGIAVAPNTGILETDLRRGRVVLGHQAIGNLLLEVSPTVGTADASAGLRYGLKLVPAFSDRMGATDDGLWQAALTSKGDFTFAETTNDSSTEAFNARVNVSYLNTYRLGADDYHYSLQLSPAAVEADQQFTVVDYVLQPRAYVEVPFVRNALSGLLGHPAYSPIAYLGTSAVVAVNGPAGVAGSFESRLDMGFGLRIPLLQTGGIRWDDPAATTEPRDRLFLMLAWDGRYLVNENAYKSFLQTQLSVLVTDDVLLFATYRLGEAQPQYRAVHGVQLGVTWGWGGDRAKTQLLIDTVSAP